MKQDFIIGLKRPKLNLFFAGWGRDSGLFSRLILEDKSGERSEHDLCIRCGYHACNDFKVPFFRELAV